VGGVLGGLLVVEDEEVEPVLVVGGVFGFVLAEELLVLVVDDVVPRVPELLELVPGEVEDVLPDVVLELLEVELVVPNVPEDVPGEADDDNDEEEEEVELVVPSVPELVPGVVTGLVESVLPDVAVVPSVPGLEPVPAVVPKVAGLEPPPLVTMVVTGFDSTTVVLTVPCVVDELPVLVSGPLDEPEVGPEDVLEVPVDGGGVMIHLHALVTLSIFC
jgi:hypothetical protein